MGTAIIAAIPAIAAAAPQVVSLISGLLGLIHKHEATVNVTPPTVATPGGFPATPIEVPGSITPATGSEKKNAVMTEFEAVALPFVAPLLSIILKRPIDSETLMPVISSLIDDLVSLNNALGIFTK